MINYFKDWNCWRKYNHNGFFFQLLVLFGLAKSNTFALHRALMRLNRAATRIGNNLNYLATQVKVGADEKEEEKDGHE